MASAVLVDLWGSESTAQPCGPSGSKGLPASSGPGGTVGGQEPPSMWQQQGQLLFCLTVFIFKMLKRTQFTK